METPKHEARFWVPDIDNVQERLRDLGDRLQYIENTCGDLSHMVRDALFLVRYLFDK